MSPARRHGNEKLRKAGVAAMWVGFALAVMPALPADPFAGVHDILVLWQFHWWLKFAGVAALVLGNIARLIGTQGHAGLPWPPSPRFDPMALARWSVRKRLLFHRRHPGVSQRRRFSAAVR